MIHSASIACGDMLNIERDVRLLQEGGISFLHIDIMDGHDVPNICLNFDHIRQLRALSKDFVIETHLMVTNPMDFIDKCFESGSDYFVTHKSNLTNVNEYIAKVKEKGMKVGLVLKREDSVLEIKDFLKQIDEVLLMSITPGDYGRPFDPIVYEKIKQLNEIRKEKGFDFLINVDGGVTKEIAKRLKEYGADAAVSGVFTIFKQPEGILESIKSLNAYIDG